MCHQSSCSCFVAPKPLEKPRLSWHSCGSATKASGAGDGPQTNVRVYVDVLRVVQELYDLPCHGKLRQPSVRILADIISVIHGNLQHIRCMCYD